MSRVIFEFVVMFSLFSLSLSLSLSLSQTFLNIFSHSVPLPVNGSTRQTISSLVPVAPNGYNIIPPNPKIILTSSGDLMTMILSPCDSGTYTITSPDFNGTIIIELIVFG